MLFVVKNYFGWAVVLCVLFAIGAIEASHMLSLDFTLKPQFENMHYICVGGMAIAASDGILHGFLMLTLGSAYRYRYRALAELFRLQGPKEILAGGLLAAAEEMIFRGVLLDG